MKNFAVFVLALLLMMSSVTEQQQQETIVEETTTTTTTSVFENDPCKDNLSSTLTTTSVEMRSLLRKRFQIAGLQGELNTAIKEAEELNNEVQNLTSEIQEMEATCTGFLPLDCCQRMIVSNCSANTGLYAIQDPCVGERAFNYGKIHVRCDMETDGGGWIVIQRRIANGTVNFTRNWDDYENGFGDLDGEFWIGLGNIHKLTNQQEVELQISVWNDSETSITWNYQTFQISGPETKYRLTVSGGTGDGIDSFGHHNGRYFSTYDRDNDGSSSSNCAYLAQGGWWYVNCYRANLNGRHQMSGLPGVWEIGQLLRYYDGTLWSTYTNTMMMIRSKTCGLC